MTADAIHMDGDFATDVECKYHCSPTCHPAQVGPEWKYGCKHKAWPANRVGDFVPLVQCGGLIAHCDLVKSKLLSHYKRGLRARVNNAQKKVATWMDMLEEAVLLDFKKRP